MERKCAMCNGIIQIDKNNTDQAIQYKKKFYHYECFHKLCDEKIASPRTSAQWQEVKQQIDDLVAQTTKEQTDNVARDELNRWIMAQYNLSCMSKRLYEKLASVNNGTYKGLVYAISWTELLDEWKYYWDEICAVLGGKELVYEAAVNYSIAILLSKNAEYREILKRREAEEAARKVEVRNDDIDSITLRAMQRNSSKNTRGHRRVELFKEVMGDGN